MIRRGIKNYFINLKHYFSSLGVFALGVVLGISVLIPGTIASVKALAESVTQATGGVRVEFRALFDCIAEEVSKLDWADPSRALETVFSAEWLKSTFTGCIHALLPDAETYAEQITGAVTRSVTEIAACAVVFLFFAAVGLVAGFLLTRWLVKRTIAKRSFWKNLLSALFDMAFTALSAAALVWFGKLWTPGAFIAGIALALLYSAAALLKAYVIYAWKKAPIKKIVNFKNAVLLILTNFIVFLITAAFAVLGFALTNAIAGTMICIPFFFIGLSVVVYNAEAYVKVTAEGQEQKPPAEKAGV